MLPLLLLPALPSYLFLLGLALITLLLLGTLLAGCRLLAMITGSFLWAVLSAKQCLYPLRYATVTPVSAVIEVVSLNIGQRAPGYSVRIRTLAGQSLPYWRRFLVKAYWPKQAQLIQAGQRWQVTLTLRPVHAQLNEGGFDSQHWAVVQRQLCHGYIRQATLLTSQPTYRQRLINQWRPRLEGFASTDLLLALLFGERSRLSSEHRHWLQWSGIAHLLAISGLHISLVAGLGWGCGRLLQWLAPWGRLKLLMPLGLGWVLATLYTGLAGANPPALRAWLALSIIVWLRLRGYYWLPSQLVLRVVALLLLYDPLLVLSSSFWLSITAVSVLLFWCYWVPRPRRCSSRSWRFLFSGMHLQCGLLLLLLPLQVGLFQGVTLWALPVNLLAVPWVSLCTMPLLFSALLISAWPPLSQILCQWADHSLVLLCQVTLFERLATTANQGWLNWPAAAHGLSYLGWYAVIVKRLVLWPTHYWTLGVLLLVTLAPLLGPRHPEWRADLLDVGHGLAVVISRQGRALLYDVGTAWPGGSVAERVIIPHLHWRGLSLDGVILSHQDRDHAGGWPVIQQRYPQIWLRSAATQPGAWPCRAGEHWRWQGLYFEVLWPPKLVPRAYNRDSCTLRVSDGQHQVLLTGDLERSAEWRLVRERPQQLAATVLLVPHHGSRTSSSEALLSAVKPQAAIVSVARYNAWRLPAAIIQNRYQQQGIAWYSTAQAGQITLRFSPSGWQLLTYRHHLAPRWYHQWWGAASPTG